MFRENALRVQAMESEQADLKLKAEEERKLAMSQVADGFEQAIGKIIEAVSSASSEIELAAGSLTRTAETSHKHTADGGIRFRPLIGQRAIGGRRFGADGFVGDRNQPPGEAIGRHHPCSRASGRADQ